MTFLPDEILCLICAQLWHQRDLNSLFNCACSGKRLAAIATTYLYRTQCVAPVTEFSRTYNDEGIPAHARLGTMDYYQSPEQIFMKCVGLWRSIILSSLGKTLYPYSHCMRTLNLGDLDSLFALPEFKARISKDFFQGELVQFKVYLKSQFDTDRAPISNDPEFREFDTVEIIDRIGEAITKQTPLLEDLGLDVNPPSYHHQHTKKLMDFTVFGGLFARWIPRLPRLKHLEFGPGLMKDNGALIRLHCPLFKGLRLTNWYKRIKFRPVSDLTQQDLAAFVHQLGPRSLESFKSFTVADFRTDVFRALATHSESLATLELRLFPLETTISTILLLKGCTNLRSLLLAGVNQGIEFDSLPHDAYCETVTWLKQCKNLQHLGFVYFARPDQMAQILVDASIHLTSLEFEGSPWRHAKTFYQALENQTRLKSLRLKFYFGHHEQTAEAEALVESLCKLTNLTELRLDMSGSVPSFYDKEVVKLARNLPRLEVWSIRTCELSDVIWGEIASLRSLRRLGLFARTNFTTDGIVSFVENLGDGNKGLVLDVSDHLNHHGGRDHWRVATKLIQNLFVTKLGGWFEFDGEVADHWQWDSERLSGGW